MKKRKKILKNEYEQKKFNLKMQTHIKPKSAKYTCNLKKKHTIK